MLIQKRDGLSYYEMGDYVDKHISTEDRDIDKIFEYLFHMAYLITRTRRLFRSQQDYEDYSLWIASDVLKRLNSFKNCGDQKILKVGAYIKTIVPLRRNDFLLKVKNQFTLSENRQGEMVVEAKFQKNYLSQMTDDHEYLIKSVLESIPLFVRQEVSKGFFKSDRHYIDTLISVNLTLTDWITCFTPCHTTRLFNLSPEQKDIITVYANKVLFRIRQEIRDVLGMKQSYLLDDVDLSTEVCCEY